MVVFYLNLYMTKQHISHENIAIANLGGIDLSLSVTHIGNPKAQNKVLIINNLHGNELTGFYVLEEALQSMPIVENGLLSIISSANPLGLLHKQRFMPIDNVDLNRGYPPQAKERGIQVVLKNTLLEIGSEYDVIIDLHTFVRPSLSAAMVVSQASEENTQLIEDLSKTLGIEVVYKMNIHGSEEKRVASAFAFQMIAQGKAACVVEYSPIQYTTASKITHFAQGLIRALSRCGLYDLPESSQIKTEIPTFERRQMMSRSSGLFLPKKVLKDQIDEGEVLGYIIDVKTLEKKPLISEYSGVVTEIAAREFYVFGEKLITIGVEQ